MRYSSPLVRLSVMTSESRSAGFGISKSTSICPFFALITWIALVVAMVTGCLSAEKEREIYCTTITDMVKDEQLWYTERMHAIILTIHIIMMVSSLALMGGALAFGLFGRKSAVIIATFGEVVTILGSLMGIILLLGAPLSIQCATLTAYIAGMTALYVFGFGMGDVENAKLIRKIR